MTKNNFSFNWPLIGNDHITEFLSKSIVNESVGGSYIFYGPEDLGKSTIANFFARALICSNNAKKFGKLPCGECAACVQAHKGLFGDLHIIKKEEGKKNISIEQIREFIRLLGLASFLNSYKIGIIKNAEYLSIEAANALLKTLEEPKKSVVIILITSNIGLLPETVLSRSKVLEFKPVRADAIYDLLLEELKAPRSQAKDLSHLSLGKPALAIKFFKDKDFYKDYKNKAEAFLDLPRLDINERAAAVEALVKGNSGAEAVSEAAHLLEIWQSLARDLLLINHHQENLVRNLIYLEKMKNLHFTTSDLLAILHNFQLAKIYLTANVNSKSALENAVWNI